MARKIKDPVAAAEEKKKNPAAQAAPGDKDDGTGDENEDEPEEEPEEDEKDARRAERQRIGAILKSPEAEGRSELAMEMALESDLDAALAVKLLGKSPKHSEKAGNLLSAAMKKTGNPDLGTEDDGEKGSNATNPLLASQKKHRPASLRA